MFLNFILRETTLTFFVPGVPYGYHGKTNFVFDKLKLDVLVDSEVLITNMTIRAHETLLFFI